MKLATVSSKGQITIPKSMRELLNLNTGDPVALIYENGNIMIQKATVKIYSDTNGREENYDAEIE